MVSKCEFIINLKTAKALGLKVPWQLQQLDEMVKDETICAMHESVLGTNRTC
jgi:hypothetical protein